MKLTDKEALIEALDYIKDNLDNTENIYVAFDIGTEFDDIENDYIKYRRSGFNRVTLDVYIDEYKKARDPKSLNDYKRKYPDIF